jgi:hypothetical protein
VKAEFKFDFDRGQRLMLGLSSFSHSHHLDWLSPQFAHNHGHLLTRAPPLYRGMWAGLSSRDGGIGEEEHEGGPWKWEAQEVRHEIEP